MYEMNVQILFSCACQMSLQNLLLILNHFFPSCTFPPSAHRITSSHVFPAVPLPLSPFFPHTHNSKAFIPSAFFALNSKAFSQSRASSQWADLPLHWKYLSSECPVSVQWVSSECSEIYFQLKSPLMKLKYSWRILLMNDERKKDFKGQRQSDTLGRNGRG